ncbi:MAG TPA: hypothetical protein VG033_04855 [Candidatus Acidoferrales bacterium]|jgi:hypothetical protein|nr:hypothetical protein [Candidatus Acidoferrales bacterium]
MTHKFIGTTLLFLFSLSVLPRSSRAQAPPLSDDNATALLAKSLAATNLKASAKQPFHLTGTVKYKSDGPTLTGRFEILFSRPDRYRINIAIGKTSETQVAAGDKLYIARSPQKFSPEAWRIAEFLWFPGAGLQTLSSVTIGKSTTYPTVRVTNNCAEESDALRTRKACFDPSQGITSFAIQDQNGSRLIEDVVSLGDFHSVGASRYPGRLTKKSVWDTIDATVDSFTAETAFDESVFTPPANSITRDWCASPQAISGAASVHYTVTFTMYVYYVLVGTNGRSKKLSFVNDPMRAAFTQARDTLERKPYPILTCSGKPIEYEMVVITNSF